MIKLNTEVMNYFRRLATTGKLTGLVDADKITNEVAQKYDEKNLPAIIFEVTPNGKFEPVLGERSDTLVVTIVNGYSSQLETAEISEIIRKEFRGMMGKAITNYEASQTPFPGLIGTPRCVISKSREKTSEQYSVSEEDNLLAYEHRFGIDWYEK